MWIDGEEYDSDFREDVNGRIGWWVYRYLLYKPFNFAVFEIFHTRYLEEKIGRAWWG